MKERRPLSLLHSILAIILALQAGVTLAGDVALYVWQPSPGSIRLIIPVPAGSTPEQSARAYLRLLRETAEFKRDATPPPDIAIGGFTKLEAITAAGLPPRFGLLGSEFEHLTPGVPAIESVVGIMNEFKADPFVIPVAADLILAEDDQDAYHEAIAESFAGMMVLGGYDVDPSQYGEANHGAKNTSPLVDRSQIRTVRAFMKRGRGMLFGACRGHQVCAVARGAKLIQDIQRETKNTAAHRVDSQQAEHRSPDSFHLVDILPSQLSIWMGGARHAVVVSRHHQAVKESAEDPATVVAVNDEGGDRIIEALEMALAHGGFMLTVQWHPESAMHTPESKALFRSIIAFAALVQDAIVKGAGVPLTKGCGGLFEAS